MTTHFFRLADLAFACGPFLAAQSSDDTLLKQVIIFGRHAVRTPASTNATLFNFSVQQFPIFPDASSAPLTGISVITPNGAKDETLLGGYFRLWLTQEGILTGNDAAELALTRSVLFSYPAGQTPPPTPSGKVDVTAVPITITAGNNTLPVSLGGLAEVAEAIDPFVMEYTDGLPLAEVGWGQLTAGAIGQIFRLYDLLLNLEYRTTYLATVQSSNLASHIVRSLVQGAIGNPMPGALANPSTKVIALIAANTNIVGLAGLFHRDWLAPSYQPDVAAPSGALVFELRQSQSTGEYIVRASYVAQTMDQLRNQTVLTLAAPPASVPVFVPGCSGANATFDCPLGKFVSVASQLIDPHSADLVN